MTWKKKGISTGLPLPIESGDYMIHDNVNPTTFITLPNIPMGQLSKKPALFDSYNRANVAQLTAAETGQAYTAHDSTFGIVDKQCSVTQSSSSTNLIGKLFIDAGVSNYELSCDMVYPAGTQTGLYFRAVDDNNRVTFDMTPNGLRIRRRVSGSFTELGTYPITLIPNIRMYKLKVIANGSNIKCYLDNTLVFDVSIEFFLDATLVGFIVYNPSSSDGSNVKIDNLMVEAI